MGETETKRTEEIRSFWNQNPVGSNFVEGEPSLDFFQEYDRFRYQTEGHILQELDGLDFENKKVLEIGIGQAADSMQIIDRGGIYYGIDLTPDSANRARERFRIFEKPFQQVSVGSAEEIDYPDSYFDFVYTHGVIHHSPEIEKIVQEIHRVLIPGGKAVVMLYHRNSINYHLSIRILRRVGLLILAVFPFLNRLIAKITGEQPGRLKKHLDALKTRGLSYLDMTNFIHKSTDGPDNVYSSVWSRKSASRLFTTFKMAEFRVHFLNERHLLGLQLVLPAKVKTWLSKKYGWHLWVIAQK